MSYNSPGVNVTNVFQPTVSPTVGGDRVMALVGKVLITNLNLYPKKIVESRRVNSGMLDSVTFTRPDPGLGESNIDGLNRITKIWQGSQEYTTISSDSNVLSVTKGSAGSTDTVESALSIPATGGQVLAVYKRTDGEVANYTPSTDYSVSLSDGASGLDIDIDWSGAETEPTEGDTYYVIAAENTVDYYAAVDTATEGYVTLYIHWSSEVSASPPIDGSSYLVQTRVEYPYDRTVVTDYSDVIRYFGPLVDPTNPDFTDTTKINQLSLAAYIAFAEGAPSMVLVPYDDEDLTYATALDQLSVDDTVNIVVPIDGNYPTTGGTTLTDLTINHVKDASSEVYKKFRVGIINPTVDTFNDAYDQSDESGYKAMAELVDSRRIVIVGPSQFNFSIPLDTGQYVTFRADGSATGNTAGYGAVVYAAMMCRSEYDIATAMLRKESRTIAKIRRDHEWDDKKLDMIAALGITLFSKVAGAYRVRDDITCSQDAIIMRMEPAITMISDNIAKTAIRILDASIVGSKLLIPESLNNVRTRLLSMLASKARPPALITGFGTPEVTVDPVDPRRINVTVPIQPVQKTREINITFSYVSSL